jgi:LacI family transcriptional regulator
MSTPSGRPRRILVGFRVVEALSQVLQGIGHYVRERGRRWEVRCVDAEEFSRILRGGALDGAITTIPPSREDLLAEVKGSHVPVVNMMHDCQKLMPSVLSDEAALGRAAARDLMARGFRNFAYLGFAAPWSRGRQRGFTDALAEAGLRCHVCERWARETSFRFLDAPGAARTVQAWMAGLPKPVAVLACSDSVASTAMGSWLAAGMRVPQDAAVMGVGNFAATCEMAPVPLSSVAMDFPRMAFEAARVLDGMMAGERPERPSLVPPAGVVSRRSTNAYSFDDENVSAAMTLIHERAAEGLTLKELLRHVPVSRRWLGQRFKQFVGRTASQEIRRLRLERVRDLLLNTDLTVQQIAGRCGFSRPENLTRFFRDGYGVPPEAYRARNVSQKTW